MRPEGMRWSSEAAVLLRDLLQFSYHLTLAGSRRAAMPACKLDFRVRSVSFSLPDPSSPAGPGLLFFHSSLGIHIYGHPTPTGAPAMSTIDRSAAFQGQSVMAFTPLLHRWIPAGGMGVITAFKICRAACLAWPSFVAPMLIVIESVIAWTERRRFHTSSLFYFYLLPQNWQTKRAGPPRRIGE